MHADIKNKINVSTLLNVWDYYDWYVVSFINMKQAPTPGRKSSNMFSWLNTLSTCIEYDCLPKFCSSNFWIGFSQEKLMKGKYLHFPPRNQHNMLYYSKPLMKNTLLWVIYFQTYLKAFSWVGVNTVTK